MSCRWKLKEIEAIDIAIDEESCQGCCYVTKHRLNISIAPGLGKVIDYSANFT
ncbi:hypothetical protein [Microcoleus sp. S13C4]|uniref:hypothetical protein n=1 Tax=Microcoleus sp. S13C4 TaxID=3055410 RepID=UPI002FCEBC96